MTEYPARAATLNPPARICGPLPRYSDPAARAERLAWIASLPDSVTNVQIAAALHLSTNAVSVLRRKARPARPKAETVDRIRYRGVRFGVLSAAVVAMPPKALDALEARASRQGKTLAEVLAAAWVQGVAA